MDTIFGRRLHRAAMIAVMALLAACAGPVRPAEIPLTGVNANNGGSEVALQFDAQGHGRFRI